MNKTMIRRKACINELGNTYRTLIAKHGYNEKFCHECIHAFDGILRKHGFTFSLPAFNESGAPKLFRQWICMNGTTSECHFLARVNHPEHDWYLASKFQTFNRKFYMNGKNTPKENWDDVGFECFHSDVVDEWLRTQPATLAR